MGETGGGRGELVAMGTVTHQWRCRPVSLGQTCSEREEKKEQREGKQKVQRRVGEGGGSEGEETGRGRKKDVWRSKKRSKQGKGCLLCTPILPLTKENICYTCTLS